MYHYMPLLTMLPCYGQLKAPVSTLTVLLTSLKFEFRFCSFKIAFLLLKCYLVLLLYATMILPLQYFYVFCSKKTVISKKYELNGKRETCIF